MKTNHHMLACSAAALCLVSCMQNQAPIAPNGDRALTTDMTIDRPDCTLVLGRAYGEDTGLNLLGFIPLKTASESVAVDNMYANARQRGATIEGEARQFVNTSIEHSSRNLIIFSTTKVRAAGDLVQFNGNHRSTSGKGSERASKSLAPATLTDIVKDVYGRAFRLVF